MSERATFEELLEFANKVREAGGGNPLDALLPAVPTDERKCLIARNLNFNCSVVPAGDDWCMAVLDADVRARIAAALDLKVEYREVDVVVTTEAGTDVEYLVEEVILLPERIGQVASDFDGAQAVLLDLGADPLRLSGVYRRPSLADEDRQLVEDMWPYIEASVQETYKNGLIVDGKLVL